MKNFTNFYNSVDDALKVSYLKFLLESDKDLQKEFKLFIESIDKDSEITIDIIKKEISTHISMLEFDYEDGGLCDYYGYQYWQEGDLTIDLVTEILEAYFNRIKYYLEENKYLNALKLFIAFKELPYMEFDCDEELFFGDEAGIIEIVIENFEDKFIPLLKERKIDDENFYKFVDIILKREEFVDFNLDRYYEIFKAIINKDRAIYLLNKLKSINEDNFKTFIFLLEAVGDKEKELKYLEKYYNESDELLEKLFKLYKELKLDDKINSLSVKLMKEGENNFFYKNYYSCLILEYLDKNKYKNSYIKALKGCILKNNLNKNYIELQEIISKEERLKFLKEEVKDYSFSLFLDLLNIENEYHDILNEVNKNIDGYYSFSRVIDYLIKPYPKELFDLTKKRANLLINQRGREKYQRVVKYLLRFKDIKEVEMEFKEYIDSIYNTKPRLPALREELKNAGLTEDLGFGELFKYNK